MKVDHEFLKGELNKFHGINQELKNIFTDYYMDTTQFIHGTNKLHKGKHFVVTEYKFPFNFSDDVYLKLDSASIFEAIGKNKKHIKSFKIDNDVMLYGDEYSATIGNVVNKAFINKPNIDDMVLNDSFDNNIELTSDAVERLVKNAYININKDGFRTRITKEVIPGLKKSHDISISFSKHETDRSLFYLIIKADRTVLTSYHIYTCLYM